MRITSMAIEADDGLIHERVIPVSEGIAGRSDGKVKAIPGGDESHEPEPYPLHAKLLAMAEVVQPTNAVTLAEFKASLPEKASEINVQDETGKTALHIAIEQGLDTEARCLIDAGASVAIGDHEGQNPLYLACLKGKTELVELLLRKGATVNDASNDPETPLVVACRKGYTGIVNILLDRKANTKTSDKNNWTPLHWASWENLEETVKRLLALDTSNIDAVEKIVNWTSLNAAAYRGHEKIVALLLRYNADLYIKDNSEWTPLMTATSMQYPKVVEMILGHKIGWKEGHLEICDDENHTPLHVASMEGYYEIVRQLVDAGANCNARDRDGMTPLHLASGASAGPDPRSDNYTASGETSSEVDPDRYFRIVESLLLKKADPNIVDRNSETALHRASKTGDKKRIDVLLKSTKLDDLPWEKWKDSPVHSALVGKNPQAAMESLLAERKFKEAPFWKEGGRFEVIKKVLKLSKPLPILRLIIGEEPGHISPKTFQNWGPVQWAAHERLPDALSDEINMSEPRGKLFEVVHEALQNTCESENTKELESDVSCERLLRVMAILITNSAKTRRNEGFVRKASERLSKTVFPFEKMGQKGGKKHNREQEQLSGAERLRHVSAVKHERKPESSKIEESPTRVSRSDKHLDILRKLRDILKDPPFGQASRTYKDEVDYEPPVPGPDHKETVEKAEATVVAFYKGESDSGRIRRNRGVQEIVYGQGPTKVVEGCIRDLIGYKGKWGMPFADTLYANENLKLTWVHLPSTNQLVWMNDLLTNIMSKAAFKNQDYSDARSFFRDSWVEVPDGTSHSRMMRPQLLTQGGEPDNNPDPGPGSLRDKDKDERFPASAIYMPYLAYSTYCRDWEQGQSVESQELRNAHAYYESLMQSYEGQQQHGSPTIDEWYYQFAPDDEKAMEDQKKRNESQVVSKYLGEDKDANGNVERNQWTVIRVNQLWIWTISKNWIITAASFPFDKSPDALVDEILNLLNRQADSGGGRAQPASADQLLTEIIDHCVGSYERTPEDNNKISIGQTFSRYINSLSREETTLFDSLLKWSPDKGQGDEPDRAPANSEVTKKMDPRLYNERIETAKTLCSKIKDVRDELSILKSVVRYQQIVQRGIEGTKVDESRLSSTYVMKNLEERDDISARIQSAVNTTLSLQQSELANSQAIEATKQGNTVMTFTFATVLFLPLSFLSSLFALDVASFQEAPAWAFYVIFFVSAGISLILGFGVFYWDNIKRFMKLLFDSEEKAYQGDSRRTPGDLNLPGRGQDGNGDEGRGDRPPTIASQIEATKPGFRGLFRRHIQRAKAEGIENNAIV
ncbi:hypothetical protein FPRO03_11556 [Fusarium proliferatum]|nr:hypothetical protein FPRO03_11556 [Fusarium proliferatum]